MIRNFINRNLERTLQVYDKNQGTKADLIKDEERAYRFGVSEAFRAVRTILNLDGDHIVFHLEGHNCIEEFDLDELIEIIEEKEGY